MQRHTIEWYQGLVAGIDPLGRTPGLREIIEELQYAEASKKEHEQIERDSEIANKIVADFMRIRIGSGAKLNQDETAWCYRNPWEAWDCYEEAGMLYLIKDDPAFKKTREAKERNKKP